MNTPETKKDRPYSRKEVVEIIQSALTSVGSDTDVNKKLKQELSVLSEYISSVRSELAQMRSIEISHNHIPTATDELDAVVDETAKATGTIMDACDTIGDISQNLDAETQDKLTAVVTRIYEACTFQDITGQRITKVVKTLKNIENKVSDILEAFGHPLDEKNAKKQPEKEEKPASLLNGPQLNGPAVSQADIDKLLASFDK